MFYKKEIKAIIETDVLVCGLGPAGVTAAVAAARRGHRVFGIEKCSFAGGNITNASVIGVCGALDLTTGKLITGGLSRELLVLTAMLRERGKIGVQTPLKHIDIEGSTLYKPISEDEIITNPYAVSMIFDAERFKLEADRLLGNAGVQILYHTTMCDVLTEAGRVTEIILANKDGLTCVRPKVVVDCTGDGDIAAWAGAPFVIEEKIQAGTTMFAVGGVAVGGVSYDDFRKFKLDIIRVVEEAHKRGEINLYCGPSTGSLWPGVVNFNVTRLPYNQTIESERTLAEIRGREDIDLFIQVFRRDLPDNFANAYLIYTGPQVGARESRRIIGEYVLTFDDIRDRRHFEDTIALGGHPLDFHDPTYAGHKAESSIPLTFLKPYEIPYRTLVPLKIENMLVAGRCHSADQAVSSSSRVSVTAMLMGEAAGIAAALSLEKKQEPVAVNVEHLRKLLCENGSVLEW